MPPDHPVLPVHRHPREIPHVLVGSGQLVKQRGLSAVLVPHQREGQHRPFRQRIPRSLGVEDAFLSQSGVGRLFPVRLLLSGFRFFFYRLNLDPGRVVQPQRQLVSPDHQLHGVSQRGEFHHRHVHSGNQPHVQKMLPQLAFPADFLDSCALSRLQILQRHIPVPSGILSFFPGSRSLLEICQISPYTRMAFSVVYAATSSGVSPRISASFIPTYRTFVGSFLVPRTGSGAI